MGGYLFYECKYKILESGAFSYKISGDNVPSNFEGQMSDIQSTSHYLLSFGNNQAHNNMPPYLVVNVWKRIA